MLFKVVNQWVLIYMIEYINQLGWQKTNFSKLFFRANPSLPTLWEVEIYSFPGNYQLSVSTVITGTYISVCFRHGGLPVRSPNFTYHTRQQSFWVNINKKNPEAKDYVFSYLFTFVSLGAKPKADWIFKAFALMGQWKGKNMKVWLTEWTASDWSLSSSHFFC